MRPISPRLKEELKADPYYSVCAMAGFGGCKGRVTWHHPWIYSGRQIIDKWATVPACEHYHHDHANKEFMDEFKRISLRRATPEDLAAYPKKDWAQEGIKLGI